ncbi:myocilin opposite strand protein [Piliocolobus tephrosceles]|uniref:myocilin opposite strand protein n=1 Tax=Piliocolobus tephrosceles TaxID=591936 RepID=UPI000C29B272|nr:myocilin opposite strand protein [Piliocolobus tephrosceles]
MCSDFKFLKSPECKAMAQKSSADNGINLPYKDLTSEVTRRRVTMTTRKEIITQKSDEAKEMLSHLDLEQTPPPRRTHLTVPPAPPPSPAEDPTVS